MQRSNIQHDDRDGDPSAIDSQDIKNSYNYEGKHQDKAVQRYDPKFKKQMRASFAKRPAQEDQLSVEYVSDNEESKEEDSEYIS